jgi:glutamine amidotransferase
MIKIIDYGVGNCGSVQNMLRHLGSDSEIAHSPDGLTGASALILPGVGRFDFATRQLDPFREVLQKQVLVQKTPFLGICLGMQLLFERSEEVPGLGLAWIPGRIQKFDFSSQASETPLSIPHMGWNNVLHKKKSPLFQKNEERDERYYFVHSYHAVCENIDDISASSLYGYEFTCAVQRDNIFGVQFHPEKSHSFGKQLFKNFLGYINAK